MTSEALPRTCYIHIGPPKTGSSSIKLFLRTNEERLASAGLFFPKLLRPDGERARSHEDLARAGELTEAGDLAPGARLWPEVDAVASKGEMDVLLSSELFAGPLKRRGRLDPILSYFEKRGYRVVIIAYVRDQPAWLNSWYVQSQKRMIGLRSFETYVEDAIETGRVEPARYLANYLKNPRCRLEVVSFDEAARNGLELDFIRRCGISPDVSFEATELRNSNAGAKTVHAAQEIMRRLNMPEGLKLVPGYPPVYNRFKTRCRKRGWDKTPFVALDQQAYEAIRARFAQSNEEFAQAHLGKSWTELCPPRTYAASTWDPATARRSEKAEVEEVVTFFAEKFAELIERHGGARADRKARNAALEEG